MPLPGNNTPWPPKELGTISKTLAEWSAWYDGTPEALVKVYANTNTMGLAPDRQQQAGGLRGLLQRMWWGRQPSGPSERVDQTHLPIAADLARASADLLYVEPPTLEATDQTTQERVDTYLTDMHSVLATGAELGAALGGRFHRVTWDKTISDRPFLTTVDADAAWPEFRWGQLVAVTFWHVVEADGQRVVRHLECHELSGNGDGLILHGLYEGTADNLGTARALADNPATKPLASAVDENGAITEGRTKGLCVAYFPNQTPQRRWRTDPLGRHLGRSDFDGVEPLMDNADEAFSSLMRDLRIGKGRIIVPEFMLRSNGPGAGATFDLDRSVYDALAIPDPESGAPQILAQQFAIRVDEHLATVQELSRQILHTAGYSTQTFGDDSDSTGAMTATEVRARERRTFRTRDRKVRNETPALQHLLGKMLAIDTEVFGTTGLNASEPVKVEFGDTAEDSPLSLAQTAQALYTARAASIETLVKMQHPDWDDVQVQNERQAILDDQGTVTDPFALR